MADTRRIARHLARSAAIALAAIAAMAGLALAAAYGLAQSEAGRGWIAQRLAAALSTPGESEIAIEALEPGLPSRIRVVGLTAADAGGVWLSAGRVEIDWRPLALLSGNLRLTEVRLRDVHIARALHPAGKAAEREPEGQPSLPVAVTVERLSIRDVALGPDLLGEAATFRITGQAAAQETGHIATTLQVERTDGGTGGARIDALFDPGTERLELNVAVNEPAGGLIARGLHLPDLPALAVSLTGGGPLADWRGDLAITLEDLASVKATVALGRGDGLGFRIAGTAASKRRPVDLPWRLVAGDVTFAVEGAWSDKKVLTLSQAHLESDAVDMRVNGRLAAADLGLDARIGLRVKDPALIAAALPQARAEGLAIDAAAKGPLLHPKLSIAIAAERLVIPDWDARSVQARLSVAPDGPVRRAGARAAVAFAGEVADLAALDLADVEPLLGRRYTWELAGDLDLGTAVLTAESLVLRAGPAEAKGRARVQLTAGDGEADLHIAIADLAGAGPLVDRAVQGRAEVDARVSVRDSGSTVAIALDGRLADIHIDEPIADALLAGQASVKGDLTLPGGGRLELRNIAVETPASTLIGEADLHSRYRRIQAAYDLHIADAAVLSPPLGIAVAGEAVVAGTADGLARNPAFAGQITVSKAQIEGHVLGRLTAEVRAEDISGEPRGSVALAATAPVPDLAGSADFAVAGEAVHLSALQLRGQGASLDGEVRIPFSGAPMTGTAAVEIADLAPWLASAGIDGGGAATATVRLTADGARQAADLDGTLMAPVWRLADGTVASAERAAVSGRIDDVTGSRAGRVSVRAAGVSLADLHLATLNADAVGEPRQAEVRIDAHGNWRGSLTLRANGGIRLAESGWTVDLAKAEGRALGQPIALQGPVTVSRQDAALTMSPLDLRFGAARLRGEGRLDAARLAGEARLDGLALATLAPLWPEAAMGGEASAAVSVAGPRDNPAGKGRLTVVDVKLGAAGQAPTVGIDVTADWRDRRLALAGRITGTPERDAELTADLPLVLDAETLAPRLPAEAPISGRLAWRGEMAALWPLVPLEGHSLSGATDMDVRLAGSLAAPQVSGHVRLTGGTYENIDSGTLLKDVALRIELADDLAVLSEFQAGDGADGRLTASGQMALDPARRFPFGLDARASSLAAVRRDDVTAVASGEASLAGDLDRAVLRAALTTDAVEARIMDRLPAEVVVLDVEETGAGGKIVAAGRAEEKIGAGPEIALDLALSMPRRVFVRGRGLDSEWAGEAKVGGTADEPVIEGELRLVRGQMTVLTKVFRLTDGTVRFPGGGDIMPTLDVVAEHKAKDLTVTARISGPATNPTVALASNPPLPRDEIVARVLFGKATTQLSALEAAQLGAAMAELSGTGGGTGRVLDFARSLLGVDVLRLEAAGEAAGADVEAGKYLRDDVYVSVKKGVTDESGKVGIEIELTPNISVESETDTTGQSDIGVKFKWDY